MPTTQQEPRICATRRGDCRKKQTRDAVAATSCSSTAVGACVPGHASPGQAPPSSTASHFWQVCLCLTRDLSQECMTVTLLKGFSLNDSSMMTPRLGYPIAFFPLLPLVSTQHNLAMNGTRNLTTVGRARMCSASSDEYDHMYHLRLLQNKPPHQTLFSIPLFTLVCALGFCTKQAAT